MDEKTLLRVSLGCCAFGMVVLFLASAFYSTPKSTLPSLSDDKIILRGTISSIQNKSTVTSIYLMPEQNIKIILFDNLKNLSEGESIEAEGFASDGELIADVVRKLS